MAGPCAVGVLGTEEGGVWEGDEAGSWKTSVHGANDVAREKSTSRRMVCVFPPQRLGLEREGGGEGVC